MSCDPDDNQCIVIKCSGDNGKIKGTDLFNLWENVYNCPQAYSNKINDNKGRFKYNENEMERSRNDVRNLFQNYETTNTITDDITSPEYSSFQETLLDLCINPRLPGICGKYLNNFCGGFTRSQVQNSPSLIEFCGCYTEPNKNYLKYTKNPACDPLCHRSTTSPKANINTGEIFVCDETVCVISDVEIKASQGTRIGGGINFTSVCAGCAGSNGQTGPGCLCIVSSDIAGSTSETMGSIGISTNFNQFCGGNSVCITEDEEGNLISESGCSGVDFSQAAKVDVKSYLPPAGFTILMVFIVIVTWILMIISRDS
jgi:hypothetical protein